MVKLLELFKGTGSFGKSAKKLGWRVTSLDNEAKYSPDILVDVLKWNYKDLDFIPDVITASPPCATFSRMALTQRTKYISSQEAGTPGMSSRVRNSDTLKPLNDYAKLGDALLKRTIEIINYWRKKNPKLKFIMENPRGSMHRSPLMVKLRPYDLATTYYCFYGDTRTKQTDFFNNFDLQLKKGSCRGTELTRLMPLCKKYRIPQPLINSIFKQVTENKISTKNKSND
jgi:site-specific DNA-cytosine methylase